MRSAVQRIRKQEGSALIVALTFLGVLMMATSAFIATVLSIARAQSEDELKTRSFYAADAGVTYALWKLEQQGEEYGGEPNVQFGDGSFTIEVLEHPADPAQKLVLSKAQLNDYPAERTQQQIRAVVKLERAGETSRLLLLSWRRDG